jgi:hypothetical protein
MSHLKTPVVEKTNVWAIRSFVCAMFSWVALIVAVLGVIVTVWTILSLPFVWLLSVVLIGDVLGVIFGITALRQIEESGRFLPASKATPEEMPERGKALARAGITIGLLSPLIVGGGALAFFYWLGSQL